MCKQLKWKFDLRNSRACGLFENLMLWNCDVKIVMMSVWNNTFLEFRLKTLEVNWKIYNMIMACYNQNDFRSIPLCIGILLLVITRVKISKILMLKVGCLRVLEEEFCINIDNPNLYIQNILFWFRNRNIGYVNEHPIVGVTRRFNNKFFFSKSKKSLSLFN